MTEKTENYDDWFDDFGDISDSTASASQSDDEWGIMDSPLTDSATDVFLNASISSDNTDTDQLEKEGWICVGKNQPLVEGDTVRFNETAWDRNDHWHKKSNGHRLNVAKIVGISYDQKSEVKIHFELLESTGDVPLSAGKKYYRYHRNIIRQQCYRKLWDDEAIRQEIVAINKINLENIQREILRNEKQVEDEFAVKVKSCVGKKKVLSDAESNMTLNEESPPTLSLSAVQQKWVDEGWLKDTDKQCLANHKPEKGWKHMDNTNDRVVVGDIIRFMYPVYSGKYPHGKYCGINIIIAKVVKVARQYYHLQFIASTGAKPYIDKRTKIFRKKFKTIEYWSFYRLWWNCEFARKDCLGKRIKRMFSSQSEYEEYIQPSEVESLVEDKKQEPSINQETNNLLQEKDFMENRFDVKQWLTDQAEIKGDVFVQDGNYYKWSGRKVQILTQLSNFVLKAEAKIVQGNQWWFECIAIIAAMPRIMM